MSYDIYEKADHTGTSSIGKIYKSVPCGSCGGAVDSLGRCERGCDDGEQHMKGINLVVNVGSNNSDRHESPFYYENAVVPPVQVVPQVVPPVVYQNTYGVPIPTNGTNGSNGSNGANGDINTYYYMPDGAFGGGTNHINQLQTQSINTSKTCIDKFWMEFN